MLDIEFDSAGDDNLQPRGLCGGIGQDLQETWPTLSIATLVECVNNKDESALRVARKGADEIKEERAFQSEVWVVVKVFCYNGSKGGKEYGKFVDESRKDVSGLGQIRVVPLAEKGSSKVVSLVKACTDRMGQRRFSDPRWAVAPVHIPLENILLSRFVGHPVHDLIEEGLPGAVHTAEFAAIARRDRLKTPE